MTDTTDDLFYQLLKRGGYSSTKARRLVFGLLLNHEPQSMHDLYARAKNDIDRASLYRTIRLFEQLGIVQRIPVGWKYKLELTDIFTHHHHHITCLSCGSIIAIKEDNAVEQLIQKVAAANGVTAVSHQLEVQGYCKRCVDGTK